MKNNNRYENVFKFYNKVNNLKYLIYDHKSNESYADHIFGSMILATAFNSEFNVTDNVSRVYRMIVLSCINNSGVSNIRYNELISELNQSISNDSIIVMKFRELESRLNSLLYEKGEYLTIEELFTEALNNKIFIPRNQEEYEKYHSIFKFYYQNKTLSHKTRSGWDKTHWNINSDRIEDIPEHIVGTIGLAMGIDSEFENTIDMDKVISTLVVHETGEILIGDITPFDGITKAQKMEIEHKAVEEIASILSIKDSIVSSLVEFDNEDTEEAIFANMCDKLEADIQSKIYQELNMHNSLSDQENNVVFNSSIVQQMLSKGASTPFDIWYLWDKRIYKDSSIFRGLLYYTKNHNIIVESSNPYMRTLNKI
jgi:putative hydrolases of HD superfamily